MAPNATRATKTQPFEAVFKCQALFQKKIGADSIALDGTGAERKAESADFTKIEMVKWGFQSTPMRHQMKFRKRGHRRKAGYGLTYPAIGQPFAVYRGDIVGGVKMPRVRWLAIAITPSGERLVSRHRSRKRAEESCRKAARPRHH